MRGSIKDYLALLFIVSGREWTAREEHGYSAVIRDAEGRCPLCSLAHEIDPSVDEKYDYPYALSECGLSGDDIGDIADAADYKDHPLRPALMAALGMRSTT